MRHVVASRTALDPIAHHEDMWLNLKTCLAVVAGLGLAFQIGHFAEHAVQFGVWLGGADHWVAATFCGRGTPYMSRPATEAVTLAGNYLFPDAAPPRQMMLAMELLHLAGNGLFLATIGAVCALTHSKWSRYAFYIEAAHLCEHLSLTLTAFYVGVPIGVSTLFGRARALLGSDDAVGWRVSWHFFMNLLPMPFTMMALMKSWPDLTRTQLPTSLPRARGVMRAAAPRRSPAALTDGDNTVAAPARPRAGGDDIGSARRDARGGADRVRGSNITRRVVADKKGRERLST